MMGLLHVLLSSSRRTLPSLPSSRRKSGPRLSACVLVESLGPGVRRDDGNWGCSPRRGAMGHAVAAEPEFATRPGRTRIHEGPELI